MGIFKGSRYTNVYVFDENWKGKNVTAFETRELKPINTRNAFKHTWIEGDRLDNLASHYYGDPRHWWFILDANPQYMEEHEIKNGDILLIPEFEELRRIIVRNDE